MAASDDARCSRHDMGDRGAGYVMEGAPSVRKGGRTGADDVDQQRDAVERDGHVEADDSCEC